MTLTKMKTFDLKDLRHRLAQSQLVLYIGCGVENVKRWEADGRCPDTLAEDRRETVLNKLNLLVLNIEDHAERLQQAPIAEQEMRASNLTQMRVIRAA